MAKANVYDNRLFSADGSPIIEAVHDLAGPAAYATSGVDPTLKTLLELPAEPFLVEGEESNGGGHTYRYNYAGKLGIIRDAAGTEVADASDQSGKTFRLKIKCAKSA